MDEPPPDGGTATKRREGQERISSNREECYDQEEGAPMIRKCSECDRDISGRRADAKTCGPDCRRYRHLRLKFAMMNAQREGRIPANDREIRAAHG